MSTASGFGGQPYYDTKSLLHMELELRVCRDGLRHRRSIRALKAGIG